MRDNDSISLELLYKNVLLNEKRIEEIFLNPKYSNISFYQVLQKFEESGGHVIGNGSYATVLYHPNWNYVLKTFFIDAPYIQFVRFAYRHPRPSFPKFFDVPRKIIPYFTRYKTQEWLYFVKMEKLVPITRDEFKDIDSYIHTSRSKYDDFSDKTKDFLTIVHKERDVNLDRIEQEYPSIVQFKEDYEFLMESHGNNWGVSDFHSRNIMKRPSTGEFVLIDPYWAGESQAQRERAALTDRDAFDHFDNDEDPSDYLKGGQRYKKPKVKKIAVRPKQDVDDEIPF